MDLGLEKRERRDVTPLGCIVVERWEWNQKTRSRDAWVELSTPPQSDEEAVRVRRGRSRGQQ